MSISSKDNSIEDDQRITINVSGNIFETYHTTLHRFPGTLLGNTTSIYQYYCSDAKQFYFNRDRKVFEAILFFYQSHGKLYRPKHVNLFFFLEECRFFRLPEESIKVMKEAENGFLTDKVNAARQLTFFTSSSKIQTCVWNFLEYPQSSKQAKMYFVIQMAFVVISIGLFSSESLGERNVSQHLWQNPFLIGEFFISIIFTVDFLARCLSCPNKKIHFLTVYTYIDLISLIPYSMMTSTNDDDLNALARFLKMIRFLRILRLVRLSTRISSKLRILFVIIQDSSRDLQIFCLSILFIILTSATVVYVCEFNETDSKFTSIPMSMWWSMQACITLGYGDILPQTLLGRIISSVYMIYGLIWMMLPILALGLKIVVYGAEIRELQNY